MEVLIMTAGVLHESGLVRKSEREVETSEKVPAAAGAGTRRR